MVYHNTSIVARGRTARVDKAYQRHTSTTNAANSEPTRSRRNNPCTRGERKGKSASPKTENLLHVVATTTHSRITHGLTKKAVEGIQVQQHSALGQRLQGRHVSVWPEQQKVCCDRWCVQARGRKSAEGFDISESDDCLPWEGGFKVFS